MKAIILIIAMLITICLTGTVPYHKRQLYFNQNNFVCEPGYPYRKDLIAISVYFQNTQRARQVYYADAGTSCSETAKNAYNKIVPAQDWNYYQSSSSETNTNITSINFTQKITITSQNFPKKPASISMIATSTIINPTIINDELWDCQIHGDGDVKPFGLYSGRGQCVMFVYCSKKNNQVVQVMGQ